MAHTATGAPPPWSTRLAALIEVARPGNVAMAILGAVIGALVAGLPELGWATAGLDVALAAAATGLVTAGGNGLNDLRDLPIDRTAHPERPLPAGRISRTTVLALSLLAFVAAQVAAFLVSPQLLLLVVLAQALLVAYELWLKAWGLVGNLAVAALVAATFLAGALAVGRLPPAVGFLSGLALLANVGRETWKDAEDAPHDVGRRTVAQRWGQATARRIAQTATLLAVALSPLPVLYGFGGWPYLALVALADAGFIAAVLAHEPARAQRRSKLAMLIALVAFTVGALA